MFVQNREVDNIEIVETPIKNGTEVVIKYYDDQAELYVDGNFRVISNSEYILVVQLISSPHKVYVLDGDGYSMFYGARDIKISSTKIKYKNELVDVEAGEQFFYNKEVKSVIHQDVPIAVGDNFSGTIECDYECDDYINIMVVAVSDEQLVIQCLNTYRDDETFFVVLDRPDITYSNDTLGWILALPSGKFLRIENVSFPFRWVD